MRLIYTLDGMPIDLDDLIAANDDTFDQETVDKLRSLRPGDSLVLGGGAWAESIVYCQAG